MNEVLEFASNNLTASIPAGILIALFAVVAVAGHSSHHMIEKTEDIRIMGMSWDRVVVPFSSPPFNLAKAFAWLKFSSNNHS